MSAAGPFDKTDLSSQSRETLTEQEFLRRHFFRLRSQRQRIDRLPNGSRKEADLQRWNSAVSLARE